MANITSAVLNTSNTLKAREIDFVMQFGKNLDELKNILGISKIIKKTPGTELAYYKAERVGNLNVQTTEGADTVGTTYQVKKAGAYKPEIERAEKTVTVQAVEKWGAALAIEKTDEEFISDLQLATLDKLYAFLKLGTLTGEQKTFQAAVAMGQGAVLNQAAATKTTCTTLAGFIGILDLYKYLGDKEVTIQTAFGLQYIKNFLGCEVLFLVPSTVLSGKVITTPLNNINIYAIDPASPDFAKLGLDYTTTGEGGFIGVHMDANYRNGTGSAYALYGIVPFAERIDLISVMTINASATSTDVSVVADSAMATGSPAKGVSDGKRKAE